MQRFHGLYAQYFNGRHEQVGHLFGGRFKGIPIADDARLLDDLGLRPARTTRSTPASAGGRTSGHGAVTRCCSPAAPPSGSTATASTTSSYFAGQGGDPSQRYAEFVSAAAKIKGQSL